MTLVEMNIDGGKIVGDECVRSLEEVEEFIEHAKLNSLDLAQESQILYFADKFENLKLLELNSDIQKALEEGQCLVFRGAKDKKAVLCTDSLTFELLEAETSNSSLLVPNLNIITNKEEYVTSERVLTEKKIDAIFYSYYELRKIKSPSLNNLRNFLNESLYCGPENEHRYMEPNASGHLYSTEDLLIMCQANASELKEALTSIGACNIDGKWRLLDFNFHLRVFSQLLNLVDSNSWPLDELPETDMIEPLEEIFPKCVVQHIIHEYTNPTYERNENGDALLSFNEDKLCRFLGEALLRDGINVDFDLEQFSDAWQSSVPEGLQTNINQLVGLAVVFEDNNKPLRIKLCSEKDLPTNIHDRIKQLFIIKKRWSLDELSTYIKPVLPEKANVKATVMKYATESLVDGVRWYSQKT